MNIMIWFPDVQYNNVHFKSVDTSFFLRVPLTKPWKDVWMDVDFVKIEWSMLVSKGPWC